MQTTITVAGITPPAPGKKQGHIIDSVGQKWNVWGDKLHNYRMGVTYDITYDTNEFNGATFNVIKTVNPANAAGAQQVGNLAGAQQQVRSPAQVIPPPQQTTPKDEMIFVCGIMNNSLSNANINPFELTATELIAMTNKARQVWRNTLGKSQSNNDDINDEIPF